MKKYILMMLGVPLAALLFVLYCNYSVLESSCNHTYNTIEELPYNKVGVVLGTSKYIIGGGINKYYQNRMDAASSAYFEGKIDYILVSGDNALMEYNEPIRMKKSLLKLGVPREKIYLDYAGFRTLDSVVRAKKIFGLESFTVISQEFHNQRAIYIGENHGIEIVAYNAENPNKKKVKRREVLARVKAYIDIKVLDKQPKYLGDKIVIGKENESLKNRIDEA